MIGVYQFIWGLVGSLALEIVDINEVFQVQQITIPERYKRVGYWIVRLCLAFMGGVLAVASNTQTPYSALAIGAAAPLVIRALPYVRNDREGPQPKSTQVGASKERRTQRKNADIHEMPAAGVE